MGKLSPLPPAYNSYNESDAVEMISRKVDPAPFADGLPNRERKDEKQKVKRGTLIGIGIGIFLLLILVVVISVWATRVKKSGLTEEQTVISPTAASTLAPFFSTATVTTLQSIVTTTGVITSTSASTFSPSSTSLTRLDETNSEDSSIELHTIIFTTYTNLPGSNSVSSTPDTTTTWMTETVTQSKSHASGSEVSISVTTVFSPSRYTVTENISGSSSSTTMSSSTRSFPPPFASQLSQPQPGTTTTSIDDLMTLVTSAFSDSVTSFSTTSTPESASTSTSTTSACNPTSTYVDVDYCHWVTDCNIEALRAEEKCHQFCANKICQNGEKDQKNMPQGQLHCCGLCGCFG